MIKKNYILISFFGGIGDQIFQFCFASYLKKKLKCNVLVDVSYYKSSLNYNEFKYRLTNLSKNSFQIKNNLFKYDFKYLSYLRIIKKLNLNFLKINNYNLFFNENVDQFIYEYFREDKKIIIKSKCFYYGYWHNLKYFKGLNGLLNLKLINPVKKKSKVKEFIKKKIHNNIVCLHVRGGDFKWVKSHNTLENNYYESAIKFYEKKIKNPTFHIYTNDIKFAKNLLKNILKSKQFEFIKKYNFNDIEEFSLFSCYKYSIIANSTFSLTSSYISRSNKITVAPYHWISNNRLNKKKIFNRMTFL